MKLVLASNNPHKAAEFERLLPGYEVEPFGGELPEETSASFRDNAELNDLHEHRAIAGEEWVLADDSGIEPAALDGRPGVRSARFAGEEATDEQNLAALLAALDFFFSSRRRHTRWNCDWSSDVCSSDLLHDRPRHAGEDPGENTRGVLIPDLEDQAGHGSR